jgi:hypothetical protein
MRAQRVFQGRRITQLSSIDHSIFPPLYVQVLEYQDSFFMAVIGFLPTLPG